MSTTTSVIVSILKKNNNGLTTRKSIAMDAKIPVNAVDSIASSLHESGLIEYNGELIELSSNQRVMLAIHAINQGTDVEKVCRVLEWKEFENFAAKAFETNKFAVQRNFRFKASRRRWEIDVVATSEPIILCVDCKRWRRGWRHSAIKRIVELQAQRTQVLAATLNSLQRRINLDGWRQTTLYPLILSLYPGPVRFCTMVPVVPILQLQNFLDEFQGHTEELTHFNVTLDSKLPSYLSERQ